MKHNLIIPSSGIDESNGDGYYILWPADPQKTANEIREYLTEKHSLGKLGVVITDSKTTPLRWGVTGVSVSHSGFAALNDYIGTKDIFGRELHFTKTNIMDATPFMYVSVANMMFVTVWIAALLGIFAALKRKKEQLKEVDEAGI